MVSWTEYGTIDHFDGTLPTWFDVYTSRWLSICRHRGLNATSKEGYQ
ncbi:hypothetical protein ACP5PY_24510 [Photobacterium leiognathi subsp. mandapamensis]